MLKFQVSLKMKLAKKLLCLALIFSVSGELVAQSTNVPNQDIPNQDRIIKSNVSQYVDFLPSNIAELIQAGEYELLISNEPLAMKAKVANSAPFPNLPSPESLAGNSAVVNPSIKDEVLTVFEFLNSPAKEFESLDQIILQLYKQAYFQPYYKQVFRLRNIQAGKVVFESAGMHLRYFQRAFVPNDQTVQLFRERIQINAPQVLRDYNFLRFVFATNDEAAVWLYSPLVKKLRPLTASNQSDDFLLTHIAYDSFAEYLPNPKQTLVVSVKEQEVYGAFSKEPFQALIKVPKNNGKEACTTVPKALEPAWNIDTQLLVGAAGHLNTRSIFYKRKVYELTLQINDPYALVQKVVLYIDRELGKILYKFSYNKQGLLTYSEIDFYSLNLASDLQGLYTQAFLNNKIIFNHQTREYSLFDYELINICQPVFGADGKLVTDYVGQFLESKVAERIE